MYGRDSGVDAPKATILDRVVRSTHVRWLYVPSTSITSIEQLRLVPQYGPNPILESSWSAVFRALSVKLS